MKAVSGLRSAMRCRNGAKSGLASGIRIDSMISPPTCLKRVVNAVSASTPGAHSLTRVTTRFEPFLDAHSAMIQDCGLRLKPARTKYGDLVVVIEAPSRIGDAAVVVHDQLDLAAGHRVAVLLHVELDRGGELAADGGKTGTGHRHADAHFQRRVGSGGAANERADSGHGGGALEQLATGHVFPLVR